MKKIFLGLFLISNIGFAAEESAGEAPDTSIEQLLSGMDSSRKRKAVEGLLSTVPWGDLPFKKLEENTGSAMALTKAGKYFVTASAFGLIDVYTKLISGYERQEVLEVNNPGPNDMILGLSFSGNGELLAVGREKSINFYGLRNEGWVAQPAITDCGRISGKVALNTEGTRLATKDYDLNVLLYGKKGERWECEKILPQDCVVKSLAFNGLGTVLAVGNNNKEMRIYSEENKWNGVKYPLRRECGELLLNDDDTVLLIAFKGKLEICRKKEGLFKPVHALDYSGHEIISLDLNSKGSICAAVANDQTVEIYKVAKDGKWKKSLGLKFESVPIKVALNDEGTVLIVWFKDKILFYACGEQRAEFELKKAKNEISVKEALALYCEEKSEQ